MSIVGWQGEGETLLAYACLTGWVRWAGDPFAWDVPGPFWVLPDGLATQLPQPLGVTRKGVTGLYPGNTCSQIVFS